MLENNPDVDPRDDEAAPDTRPKPKPGSHPVEVDSPEKPGVVNEPE